MNPDEHNFFPLSHSYLLRLWMKDAHSINPQRIVLINLQTGNHRGFENFDQLVSFLKKEPGGDPDPIPGETDQDL